MTVEICPICDIAGCKHIRERSHPMTHDTPPKRIWAFDRYVNGILMAEGVEIVKADTFVQAAKAAARLASRGPKGEVPVLVFRDTSEAEAQVAAALREAAAHGDAWIAVFGDVEIKHTPANAYAADAVLDYQDAILALIPQPASAALDKLIAEAVKAERERSISISASLAAAISLLEQGGKAAKKSAPSDKMFDQMLVDYRTSLEAWRAAKGAQT